MQSPDMTKSLLAEGSQAVSGSPADLAAHLKAEREQWTRVVKSAGIRGN
jgi:tripartite-type tricarboxylate transporter receptor subunit TctC